MKARARRNCRLSSVGKSIWISCIATITPASRTTTRGRLNIGSDAPIAGVCIAGLVEVGVGEARGTVAAIPWRSTLTARRAPARAFRGAAPLPFNAGEPAPLPFNAGDRREPRKDFRSALPLPKYKSCVYHLCKVNNSDKARQDSPGSRIAAFSIEYKKLIS